VLKVLYRWLPGERVFTPEPVKELEVEEELPVLDLEQAMAVTGGRMDMFRRISAVFLKHTPDRIRELDTAIRQGQYQEVGRLCHSIQGAAASLGGKRVWQLALRMERQCIEENELPHAPVMYERLCAEYQRLAQALEHMDWNAEKPEPHALSTSTV